MPRLAISPVRTGRLENGLTLQVGEDHRTPLVAFQLVVQNDPPAKLAAEADMLRLVSTIIAREPLLERYEPGTDVSADGTIIAFETSPEGTETAMKALGQAVLRPAYSFEAVRKEALQHLTDTLLAPRAAYHHALSLLYGPGSFLGARLRDSRARVAKVEWTDLERMRFCRFLPQNSTLVVAGDTTFEHIEKLARDSLGSWRRSGSVPEHTDLRYARPQLGGARVLEIGSSQAHLVLAYDIPETSLGGMAAALLANDVLGGLAAARFNRVIRAKLGYAYAIRSAYSVDKQGGTIVIEASLDPEKAKDALEAILAQIEQLRKEPPTDYELDRARLVSREALRAKFEAASATSAALARQFVRGWGVQDFEALDAALARTTPQDVMLAAHEHLALAQAAIVLAGNRDEIAAQLQWSKIPYQFDAEW